MATVALVVLFGVIDIGRAMDYLEVISGISRQGSNLASRGTSASVTAADLIAGQSPLNLTANGKVIVTAVTNNKGAYTIIDQASQGGLSATSKIGTGIGNAATLPTAAQNMDQPGTTIYVTEVFYAYAPITPIGNWVKAVFPSPLYSAAYF